MGFLIKLLAKFIPQKWLTRIAGVGLMLYAAVGYLHLLAPDQLSMVPAMSFDECYKTFSGGLAVFGVGISAGVLKEEAKKQTAALQQQNVLLADQTQVAVASASTRDALLTEQNKMIEKQTGSYEIRTPGTSD